ncbi:unnamed protein product [Schistocephalus solidus]|uniref:Uncharacterized protein n=1 Tax=Schistocephalus solidus TaxID=70667 RepID=A0A183SUQ6_SCHSO|nr:unnamed protein product [Schistocephalus solidus]
MARADPGACTNPQTFSCHRKQIGEGEERAIADASRARHPSSGSSGGPSADICSGNHRNASSNHRFPSAEGRGSFKYDWIP